MEIIGILKQEVTIETTPKEIVESLFSYYFKTTNYNDLVEENGILYIEYDVSMHGSPMYERKKLTKDPKKIKIYYALKTLLDNI